MSNYTITSTNPSNSAITVQDQTINNDTNLTFVGRNYSGYGPIIAEDFLHLLENFANASPPNETIGGQPLEGQLWYNKGTQQLNIYDGTIWNPVGSVKKEATAPSTGINGDIWVDTSNHQLYLYSGSTWLLVGPQYSQGLQTGSQILTIIDTDNTTHNVTAMYSDGSLIAVVSNSTFTPKITLLGFATINQGITLNSVNSTSTTAPTKFWGRASEADALNVNGSTINSSNFLRSDINSVTNQPFSIRSDGGLNLGGDLSFGISSSTNAVLFNSNSSGKGINFLLKTSTGSIQTALYINANSKVGIGPNNTAPSTALDVAGILTINNDTVSSPNISGQIVINGTGDITSIAGPSIKTLGGLLVTKSVQIGGNTTANGTISVNNLNSSSQPVAGPVILPGSISANGYYDIGSTTAAFRNVYATNFGKTDNSSSFYGVFNGVFNGNVNGTVSALTSSTTFGLTGDITSNNVVFNGAGSGTATFTTSASSTLISTKTEVTDSHLTDYLLISRSTTNPVTNVTTTTINKTSKQSFIASLSVVPVGAILPFAGITPPPGYLLCDGSEVLTSKYSALFSAIQYTYKARALLIGSNTFGLPDLRGRFPLGADNMNNRLTVPSNSDTSISISAGGGSANRVTDVTADNLGSGSGSEARTLVTENLPEHTHNLNSGSNQYYVVGTPGETDSSAISGYGLNSTSNSGYGYPYAGGVVSTSLALPVSIMDPYLTINYIIYTGVIS
jgi:microcystin-dependent protein